MKVKDNLYPPLFVMQRKVIQFVVPIVLKIWPLGLVSVGLDTEYFVEDQKLNWSQKKGVGEPFKFNTYKLLFIVLLYIYF